MTKIEPSALDIAKATLLAPFGIDEVATQRVFGTILAHRADDADLYFQYNRSEGWTLEEGEVKSGSFSIDQAWACASSPARRPRSRTRTTSTRRRSSPRRR